jgi:hypothetical protein
MRRREFIASFASTITAWPFAGLAQTASKVYRVGILSTDGPADAKSVFDAMMRSKPRALSATFLVVSGFNRRRLAVTHVDQFFLELREFVGCHLTILAFRP